MSAEEKRRMVEVGRDHSRPVRRVVSVRGSGGSSSEGSSASLSGPPSDKKGVQRAAATLFAGLGTNGVRPKPAITPERKRWDEATSDLTSIHGRPYDPERTYHEGDIILHKQFGMGVVEGRHEAEGTIDVLFRDGCQVLEAAASEV